MSNTAEKEKYRQLKNYNHQLIEEEILGFWTDKNVFHKSIEIREGAKPYIFYEGPPSANGMPGIHHVMARAIKDIFCRYKTLKGFQVERKGGWDTHGLPVELGVEKLLGITKKDIGDKISVAEYNQKCREEVMKYKDVWDDITRKMGYWVDLKNPYITFEPEYIESVWYLLKKFYDKGLLYKGLKIQPYSPAAGTGLSSHELNLPGTYKMVKDTTIVAQFKVIKDEKSALLFDSEEESVYILAWTTTPWTLPSNTALCMGPEIDYVKIKTFNPYTQQPISVVLAKELVGKWFGEAGDKDAVTGYFTGKKIGGNPILFQPTDFSKKGKELKGIRYEQLLPYVQPEDGDAFKVITGNFVTTEDGTGIVHIAPSFGADDRQVAQENGIGSLTLVDKQGKFVDEAGELAGRFVKNYKDEENYESPDVTIAILLKQENKAFAVEKYEHTYPHCWRTDKPILYYPLDSWFINVTVQKDKLVALNKTINWKPASTGEGRFGQWLENLVDWNLSRSRYWGTPLPIWRKKTSNLFDKGDEIVLVSSKGDLVDDKFFRYLNFDKLRKDIVDERSLICSKLFSIKIEDYVNNSLFGPTKIELEELEKKIVNYNFFPSDFEVYFYSKDTKELLIEYSDNINEALANEIDLHKPYVDFIFKLVDNELYFREPDLIDVWFDSGAMPYAQWHYPFENKEKFEQSFPADFIAEGVDQTRGWFYTLHVIAALLFDSVAYKNVVSNGLVLDKNGNKMSKRLGNAVDPFETLAVYGADATRWYMISNAQPWDNLKFDVNGIDEVRRKMFGTLFNTYSFFALYANIDGFDHNAPEVPLAERPEIDRWILSLLNNLIKEVDEQYAQYEPTKAARAIEDFVVENLSNWYVRLCRRRFWKSDDLKDKQAAYQTLFACLKQVAILMSPVSPFFPDFLYRSLMADNDTSIHLADFPKAQKEVINPVLEEQMMLAQQISSMVLSLRKNQNIKVRQPLQKIMIPVLRDGFKEKIENVASLILSEVNVKELVFVEDTAGIIKKKVKPNFKVLGKKLGGKMKVASVLIQDMTQEQIAVLERAGNLQIGFGDDAFELSMEDVEILSEDIEGWLVAVEHGITVALDIHISDELEMEGRARELVNRIQKERKEMDMNVTDRIEVILTPNDTLSGVVEQFDEYIKTETLTHKILFQSINTNDTFDINGIEVGYKIIKHV